MRPSVLESTDQGSGSLLGNIVRTWDRFWFTPTDPTTLCFIRICCGLLVFYVHLTYSWDLLGYVGPDAWVGHNVAGYVLRDVPQYRLPYDWNEGVERHGQGNFYWSIYYHVTSTTWIIGIHAFILLTMLLFSLGLWTRLTGPLSWVGAMSYVQRANTTVYGLDTMMMIVLLYLMIGPSGAMLSVDRWLEKRRARRRGEPVPEVMPSITANFAIRLIQVHVCIIYLAGGTSKMLGGTWWAGTALNLVMLNPNFAPLDHPLYYKGIRLLANHRPLWELVMSGGVVYTLLFETSFCFLVWLRGWRWVMVCCAVLLHLGIGLFMGLVTFSIMMMIMVISFIPPEQIGKLVDSIEDSFATLFARREAPLERRPTEMVLPT